MKRGETVRGRERKRGRKREGRREEERGQPREEKREKERGEKGEERRGRKGWRRGERERIIEQFKSFRKKIIRHLRLVWQSWVFQPSC